MKCMQSNIRKVEFSVLVMLSIATYRCRMHVLIHHGLQPGLQTVFAPAADEAPRAQVPLADRLRADATRAVFALELARRAGRTLIRALKGEVKPVIVWGKRPMLTHTLKQSANLAQIIAMTKTQRTGTEDVAARPVCRHKRFAARPRQCAHHLIKRFSGAPVFFFLIRR